MTKPTQTRFLQQGFMNSQNWLLYSLNLCCVIFLVLVNHAYHLLVIPGKYIYIYIFTTCKYHPLLLNSYLKDLNQLLLFLFFLAKKKKKEREKEISYNLFGKNIHVQCPKCKKLYKVQECFKMNSFLVPLLYC